LTKSSQNRTLQLATWAKVCCESVLLMQPAQYRHWRTAFVAKKLDEELEVFLHETIFQCLIME
jgi:hypothetical protein